MDDDQGLQIHLELMHALQTRKLRTVVEEEKPIWIGGTKEQQWSPPHPLSSLQAEFIQSSMAMQMRLRPQLERMAEIKAQGIHNEQWRHTLRELRREHTKRDDRGPDAQCKPRLLYQLEEIIQGIPGWKDLQDEVRKADRTKKLDPVEYDGFYIIKTLSTRQDFCNI